MEVAVIVAIVAPFTVTSYLIRVLRGFASQKLFILTGGGTSRLRRSLRLRELELMYRTESNNNDTGRADKTFAQCT